ncbi:MAG TPA: TonB-dependent receptor [Terriglobia bacterium]|nr:TonB-dependent receptor [Terriglobia bacterium]
MSKPNQSRKALWSLCLSLALIAMVAIAEPVWAQQTSGSITGTVTDASGAVLPGVAVKVHNIATGLDASTKTNSSGDYNLFGLPIGTYTVSFAKEGFKTETHSEIIVQANRTTTVPSVLQPGTVTTTVTVTGTPLLNKVDTTNGYILGSSVIQAIPLGTGSFTQLAILSPGVNADLLAGAGTDAGLGNQNIWANGQRDTSNSFSFNGVNANNVFNGKSSSSVSENRFVLNTGESFLAGGQIQTNTTVYNAIGQGLPTPPPETMEELRVNTSMYDASQGANSGAHVEIITRSGTNQIHGQLYGYRQSDAWNAAPFFFNADPAIPANQKVPVLHRGTFGATVGGPIKRDKLFFFASYQGVRVHDQSNGISDATVPLQLTDDRSPAALAAVANAQNGNGGATFGPPITAGQLDPAAVAILQAKLPNGQFVIPTPTITDPNTATALGFDAVVFGPPSTFVADQLNGNIDYVVSDKDRLAAKYYYQNNPTTSPFAQSAIAGFPQHLSAGSQVISLDNTTLLSPTLTWEQRAGFIREQAFATTGQPLTPSAAGINLFGSTHFPGIFISTADSALFNSLNIGPRDNFANAGVFQNQWEGVTNLNWVRGKETFSFGANWDRNQLNVVNENNNVAALSFTNFPDFLTGTVSTFGGFSRLFSGESNRYYRANQIGAFAQDNVKVSPDLTVNLGLRFDWDGPLSEAHGLLANFYPQLYQYNASTDTITNSGLVIAGNNAQFHTPGVSSSTLTGRQWGLGPRVGLAWSPSRLRNVVVRAGYGLYYDRGEFFTEFSPSAGGGFNGPFGVTLQPPFVVPFLSPSGATLSQPFGATAPAPPSGNPSNFGALLPNLAQTSCPFAPNNGGFPSCNNFPAGNMFGPFLFGGYDPANKLPYSENWQFDLQWQPVNNLVLTLGYVGNHASHLVLPIPFNQPGIATPQSPIHGQIYSYGYNAVNSNTGNTLATTPINGLDGGNTDARVPFIGYSPNSVFYEAEGISNYNALQFSVSKRLSKGLQVNGSYTWSHALDEGSGLQLFYNGNNPLQPTGGYGTSGFDRTHVLAISYLYQFPTLGNLNSLVGKFVNGWGFSGVTVLESGQPYSVIDFSGGVASIFYGGGNDFITNPIVPLASGQTSQSVQLQGTTGVNPGKPVLNPAGFTIPLLQPGQGGVPPCGTVDGQQVCDNFETGYGSSGRNIFRGPFQSRFDFSLRKQTKLTERFNLGYSVDFFNIFNHPSFDTPNNNVEFNPFFSNPPTDLNNNFAAGYTIPPRGQLGIIQHTLGSPRFIQMSLHLVF